jgi:hypothetical protein
LFAALGISFDASSSAAIVANTNTVNAVSKTTQPVIRGRRLERALVLLHNQQNPHDLRQPSQLATDFERKLAAVTDEPRAEADRKAAEFLIQYSGEIAEAAANAKLLIDNLHFIFGVLMGLVSMKLLLPPSIGLINGVGEGMLEVKVMCSNSRMTGYTIMACTFCILPLYAAFLACAFQVVGGVELIPSTWFFLMASGVAICFRVMLTKTDQWMRNRAVANLTFLAHNVDYVLQIARQTAVSIWQKLVQRYWEYSIDKQQKQQPDGDVSTWTQEEWAGWNQQQSSDEWQQWNLQQEQQQQRHQQQKKQHQHQHQHQHQRYVEEKQTEEEQEEVWTDEEWQQWNLQQQAQPQHQNPVTYDDHACGNGVRMLRAARQQAVLSRQKLTERFFSKKLLAGDEKLESAVTDLQNLRMILNALGAFSLLLFFVYHTLGTWEDMKALFLDPLAVSVFILKVFVSTRTTKLFAVDMVLGMVDSEHGDSMMMSTEARREYIRILSELHDLTVMGKMDGDRDSDEEDAEDDEEHVAVEVGDGDSPAGVRLPAGGRAGPGTMSKTTSVMAAIDPHSGAEYFHNTFTDKTAWTAEEASRRYDGCVVDVEVIEVRFTNPMLANKKSPRGAISLDPKSSTSSLF